MINVVKRTGHSSSYVEKGMGAMGKTAKQMGIPGEFRINGGGELFFPNARALCKHEILTTKVCTAFPIWLEVNMPGGF
jgi:hypothetical protein